MDVKGIRLLERIGPEGLRRALRASFDRGRLVDLANACRISFPGKRVRAVDDDRILDEMVKRFLKEPALRAVAMKALIRANQDLIERYRTLTPEELAAEVAALPDADAGRALFALGDDDRPTARTEIAALLRRLEGGPPAPGADATREPAAPRPKEDIALLHDRIRRLEQTGSELQRVREEAVRRVQALEQELLNARKETHHLHKQIAQAESARDRLKEENLQLVSRAQELARTSSAAGQVEELSVRLHQLIRESRKIAHDVELIARAAPSAADNPRAYVDALAAAVESLRREVAQSRLEREEGDRRTAKSLAELAAGTHAIHSELAQLRRSSAEPAPRRKSAQERVGLFVDVQNMYYAARQLNARLDFGALMAAVTRDRRLIRAIAYVVQNRDIDQSGFLAMLQQKNYEVRRKDLKIRHDGSSKGDWDMEMALDILGMAENLDVVALVSGDGDFASLVTQIKTLGPTVEVYSFPGSTAKDLMEAADRHVPIDEGFLIRMTPSA